MIYFREAKEKISELEGKLDEKEKSKCELKSDQRLEQDDAKSEKVDVKPSADSSNAADDCNDQRLSLGWQGSVEENIGVKEEEEDEEENDKEDVELKEEVKDADVSQLEDVTKAGRKRTSGRTDSPANKRELESPGGGRDTDRSGRDNSRDRELDSPRGRRGSDSPGGKRGRGRGRRRGQDKLDEKEGEGETWPIDISRQN